MDPALIETISGLALFADLTRPQIQAVSHTFDEARFSAGERVLRRGFTGAGFFVILKGEAAVEIEGQERATLARGDFFGEISILLGEPPTADVVATSDLHCLVLGGPELEEFLLAYPKVALRVLRSEAHRLRSAMRWRG